MARIGIVSSVPLPTGANTLYEKLTAPLGNGHTITAKNAAGDYNAKGKRKMKAAVKQLLDVSTANRPELVIAVGGLVAATAVSDYISVNDDIPFLVCIGRAPNLGNPLWDNDQFKGGINLDTPGQNGMRGAYLIQRNPNTVKSVTDICLYYNKNSHMAEREAKEWEFAGGKTRESTVDQTATDATIAQQLAADVAAMAAASKAVIVSSDPFFASKAGLLTTALRAVPTCYSAAFYTPPAGSFVYGPNIADAYTALGTKAAAYLAAPGNMGLDTVLPKLIEPPPFAPKFEE